eukprot:2676416-Rhodomonas_salina.1
MVYLGLDGEDPGIRDAMAWAYLTVDWEPESVAEALRLPDWELWMEATYAELEGLKKMGVFEVSELPPGRKAIRSRVVFKIKTRDGVPVRRKARIIAKLERLLAALRS